MEQDIVLGHVVSSKGVIVDRANINVITSLPYSHACGRFGLFLAMQVSTEGSFEISARLPSPYPPYCKKMWILCLMRDAGWHLISWREL